MKSALITGWYGQDGSYLCELLLSLGYNVYGLSPHRSSKELSRVSQIIDKINIVNGDLLDQSSMDSIIKDIKPDEVYNLAAQSFVKTSWDYPEHTSNVNALGVLRILDSIRKNNPDSKFYQASTSEMFGKVQQTPQNESTPFYPRSPYGVAKLYGHWITVNYRESYNIFACSGILFNHDSIRRQEHFVTQKIASSAARIKLGIDNKLVLGNLNAKRDIGHAKDYVYAMYLMLQQQEPDDYVISTGETHTIKDMLDVCFGYVGLDWSKFVEQNEAFMRPAEVDLLVGDSSKAKNKLNWTPSVKFHQILEEMVDYNLNKYRS